MQEEQLKLYSRSEVSKYIGICQQTLIKYEKLGIIPVKTPPYSKRKVYFQDGIEKAKILKFLLENMLLGKNGIILLFGLCKMFNIEEKNILIVANKLINKEEQSKNILCKQARSANKYSKNN